MCRDHGTNQESRLIIDRNQVRNLEDNRVTVESLFTVSDLPENNLFGLSAGSR